MQQLEMVLQTYGDFAVVLRNLAAGVVLWDEYLT